MPQSSVSTQALGFPGMLADAANKTADTGVSEEASAEIPFGVMVKKGTGNDQVKLLTATNNVLRGIVIADQYARDTQLGDTGLKPKVSMALLQIGRIWVYSEEAVNPSLAVRVRAIAAGAEIAGSFRTTADSTDCALLTTGAKWKSTTTGAGVAELEINMVSLTSTADV